MKSVRHLKKIEGEGVKKLKSETPTPKKKVVKKTEAKK